MNIFIARFQSPRSIWKFAISEIVSFMEVMEKKFLCKNHSANRKKRFLSRPHHAGPSTKNVQKIRPLPPKPLTAIPRFRSGMRGDFTFTWGLRSQARHRKPHRQKRPGWPLKHPSCSPLTCGPHLVSPCGALNHLEHPSAWNLEAWETCTLARPFRPPKVRNDVSFTEALW